MESKAQKPECNTAGTMGSGVLGVTASVRSSGNPGGNGEAGGSTEVRPREHWDCVSGHGKEVQEGSGRERNLPGIAFKAGVARGLGKGSWKPARRLYFRTQEGASSHYSQSRCCPSQGTRPPRPQVGSGGEGLWLRWGLWEAGGQNHTPGPRPRCRMS